MCIYIHIYIPESLCRIPETNHDIVNQLYFSKLKGKKRKSGKKKDWMDPHQWCPAFWISLKTKITFLKNAFGKEGKHFIFPSKSKGLLWLPSL